MAVSKVSSLNSLFNTIYEDSLFVAREMNLMSNLVTGYTAQGMATRTIPIYPSLSATEVAEGVDFSSATEWTKTSHATLTPKIVKTQVILTDERMMTDPEGARQDSSREMGAAIATKIDEDLLALFTSFTPSVGTANNALTIGICAAALAQLRNGKVRGPFSYVVHPYHWHDVWTELGQPAATQAFLGDVASQALRDYFTGTFLAAQWYVSANIAVDADADAISAVFTREALALDTRTAPEFEAERDASLAAWELNARARYAVGVRRATYGAKITADATAPTS